MILAAILISLQVLLSGFVFCSYSDFAGLVCSASAHTVAFGLLGEEVVVRAGEVRSSLGPARSPPVCPGTS